MGTLEGASRSGDYALSWTGPEGAPFMLRETDTGGTARTLYEGTQLASTVTGRREGDYSYAVGVSEENGSVTWSESCAVMVRPYSLTVAFTFFTFGLIVTLATVLLVVRGHRAHRRGEIG